MIFTNSSLEDRWIFWSLNIPIPSPVLLPCQLCFLTSLKYCQSLCEMNLLHKILTKHLLYGSEVLFLLLANWRLSLSTSTIKKILLHLSNISLSFTPSRGFDLIQKKKTLVAHTFEKKKLRKNSKTSLSLRKKNYLVAQFGEKNSGLRKSQRWLPRSLITSAILPHYLTTLAYNGRI